MTTTPTLNGKRQRIEFPESKLVYFIPFFDYGKDLRCDLTNKCFSWILAIREIFFLHKNKPYLEFAKVFSVKCVPKKANVFGKNFAFIRHAKVSVLKVLSR